MLLNRAQLSVLTITLAAASAACAWLVTNPLAQAACLFTLIGLSALGRSKWCLLIVLTSTLVILGLPTSGLLQWTALGTEYGFTGALTGALFGLLLMPAPTSLFDGQHSLEQLPLASIELDQSGAVIAANSSALALLDEETTAVLGCAITNWLDQEDWGQICGSTLLPDDAVDLDEELPPPTLVEPSLDEIEIVFEAADNSTSESQAIAPAPTQQTHLVALRLASGQDLWVVATLRRKLDSRSNERHLLQFCDVSEQQKGLQKLRAQALIQKTLFEQSHDFVFILDDRAIVQDTNPKAAKFASALGSANRIGPQKSLLPIFVPTELPRITQLLREVIAQRAPLDIHAVQLVSQPPQYIDIRIVPYRFSGQTLLALCGHLTTKYMRREQKALSNAQRYQGIFQQSPDAIAIFRFADSKFIEFNSAFTDLLGYGVDDLKDGGEQTFNLWANKDQREWVLRHLTTRQEASDYQAAMVHKAGHVVNIDLSTRFVEINGEPCVLCTARNINRRLVVEAERNDSEEKFARVFRHSPDGIALVRKRDGIIFDVNDMLIETSGYSKEELVGASLFELNVMKKGKPAAADGKVANEASEAVFVTKSGKEIPAIISINEFELSGEPHLICIAKDMREMAAAEAKLETSERRFKGAFDNAPIAILLVDMDGKIFQGNRFACDLFAYESKELPGLHISRLVPTEDRIKLKETLTRLVQGTDPSYRSERRMLCQNGLEVWTNFQIVLQRNRSGDNQYFIIQAADVTDIKLSQRRMERMAFYDTLTDLANRRLFQDRLGQAIDHCTRENRSAALLYLDLDQFKRVNDTLGHEAGDSLLRQVANRLSECVGTEDTVGRSGGDEFTVLLFDVESPSDAGSVAEKVLERMREPISVSGHNLVVTTSIGITIIPADGNDANVLMKNADLAMYRAKDRGRNNFQFFHEDMNTKAIKRLKTENELRDAIVNDELVLYFQPKVDIARQRMVGVESLIRWNHPTRGFLGPGEFIEVAEQTGAIVEIGEWVIEAACRAGRLLCEAASPEFTTAVNISPRQFRDPNLVNFIRRCLRESRLDPQNLEIEITETMLMHDVESAYETVEKLHQLGVSLAIDDFGTGYSSLNYLKKFPIQTVKVDRSFVMDIPDNKDDMAITAAVIAMAHRLNMEVVAEGVETRQQLSFLKEQDCEYAQGFLFSQPEPLSKILQILDRRKLRDQRSKKTETRKAPKPAAAPPVAAPAKTKTYQDEIFLPDAIEGEVITPAAPESTT